MINNLSIIYPIYNESKRLKFILSDIEKFNKKTKFLKKEYIFVDDGSSDKSKLILCNFLKRNKQTSIIYKLISYKKNKGKGFALKKGVFSSSKKWILTTDSDCSVSNFQILNWIKKKYIVNNLKIYFGSRLHFDSKVKKIKSREIIGSIFRLIIYFLFDIKILDTQCGFKLYEAKVAKKIFKRIKTNGYLHDIEIVIISKKLSIKIKELPLKWTHKTDGKINFLTDLTKIIISLLKIRLNRY